MVHGHDLCGTFNHRFQSELQMGPADAKWERFFQDPNAWWDNRTTKQNPKQPDFRHKDDRCGCILCRPTAFLLACRFCGIRSHRKRLEGQAMFEQI